jgi:hypothetical protein
MNRDTVAKAMEEAIVFVAHAEEVLALEGTERGKFLWIVALKEKGALRRKSMDLTRALADMRRPL